MTTWRRLRKLLTPTPNSAEADIFQRHRDMFGQARLLVRCFYAFVLYIVYGVLTFSWPAWLASDHIQPLWVVAWVEAASLPIAATIITLCVLFTALGAVVFTEWRSWRIAVFVSLLVFIGLVNSFGKVNHYLHHLLAPAFFFLFLPTDWQAAEHSIAKRHFFLRVFWAAQLLILTSYSMSGVLKVVAALEQMQAGQIHGFHPYALAYQVAGRLLQTNTPSVLGSFFVQYPLLGWPLYLAVIYWETFAIIAAFRPALHRLWGAGLILFHLGTWLTMSVAFGPSTMVLGLFLIASPFHSENVTARQIIDNLPVWGDALRFVGWLKHLRSTPQFATNIVDSPAPPKNAPYEADRP